MSRKTLYMHVGFPKTGTTTIQSNLALCSARLRAAGICQPDRLGRDAPGHHRVVDLVRTEGAQGFVEYLTEVLDLDRMVLSSESISGLIKKRSELWSEDLVDRLKTKFDVIPIIVLRRQDYMLESSVAQRAKHEKRLDLSFETSDAQRYRYDYLRVTDALARSFGQENVRVVIYRDDVPKDIWQAFCAVLGIDLDLPGQSRPRLNQKPHRRKVLALSQLEGINRSAGEDLLDAMVASDAIKDDGEPFLFSPADRRALLRANAAANRAICEQFGIPEDDAAYFAATEVCDDWAAPEPIRSGEWAAFVSDMVQFLKKRYRDGSGVSPRP